MSLAAGAPPSSTPETSRQHTPQPHDQKQGQTTLPACPSGSSEDPSVNPAAAVKPKLTKSRNGCYTCKLKRLKCDEKKPTCDQCAKRRVTCGGYKKDFKWKPFDESRSASSSSARVRSSGSSKDPSVHPAPSQNRTKNIASSSEKPKKSLPIAPASSVSNSINETRRPSGLDYPESDSYPSQGSRNNSDTPPLLYPQNHISDGVQTGPFIDELVPGPADLSFPIRESQPSVSDYTYSIGETQLPNSDTIQPPIPDSILRSSFLGTPAFASDGNVKLEPYPSSYPDALAAGSVPPQTIYDDGLEDDIEEILRSQDSLQDDQYSSLNQEIFQTQGWDPYFWKANTLRSMYLEPQLAAHSPEMLLSRFHRRTCGIMSVKDGPSENPWRTLILPLMHNNKMIFHVVMSMASLQSSKKEPLLLNQGKDHFETVFQELQLVHQAPANLDIALASMLALAFGETWGWPIYSGLYYIKQAKKLMYGAIRECRQAPRDNDHMERVKFLCRTWVYMDIISRLTSIDDDDSDDFEIINRIMAVPEGKIDPLMGCASTLFPIIGRVANLVRKVCKMERNSPAIIAAASNLKLELEAWAPPLIEEIPEDKTSNSTHSILTADSYRFTTLLYLHQAVPEVPSPSSAALAKLAMECLAAVPPNSGPFVVQIAPLFLAGCEAATMEDRQFIQERYRCMMSRLAIGNVYQCAEVVKEVWRRRDEFASNQSGLPSAQPDISGQDKLGRAATLDFDPSTGAMLPEFTVRGPLHWAGVMRDWGWEVLLG